jgi:cytochrome c oxidase subunit 1
MQQGKTTLAPLARAELRGWALLAVGALAVAGGLALLLAASRTPGLQDRLPWGADFFHKGLVTHVVFSFQVWLLAMLGAAGVLAVPAGRGGLGFAGLGLAVLGCVGLLIPTLAGWGEASLNNYVPVLVHPLYYAGLVALAGGIGLAMLPSLGAIIGGSPAQFGTAMAAVALFSALTCFAIAAFSLPAGTDTDLANERLFWGGGHVLQFVNTLLLMVAWQIAAERAFGRAPLPPLLGRAVFAAIAVVAWLGPVAMLRFDLLGLAHRQVFTQLLWVGLALPPVVMGAGIVLLLLRGRPDWRSPAVLSLALSLAVFGLGGAAGFALGAGDTRTPSHYHAMIGGVNLALMGLLHSALLPALGRAVASGRWLRAQFHLYGAGQVLHALGFYLAGLAGVARKTAGAEQGLDSVFKLTAMGMVGFGGAIAVLGGVVFVVQVLARLLSRETRHA